MSSLAFTLWADGLDWDYSVPSVPVGVNKQLQIWEQEDTLKEKIDL
jgi:hypothetical protein